jgi:hypothetical protein
MSRDGADGESGGDGRKVNWSDEESVSAHLPRIARFADVRSNRTSVVYRW